MKKTPNIFLNKPDREDRVKINDFNQNSDNLDVEISDLKATLSTKAPINSPDFIGTPTAPKLGDSTKREPLITTGYVLDALEVEKI